MLSDLPVRRVLEIGPYLGLVTAMLLNAGYDVTTLDVDRSHADERLAGRVEWLTGDVRNLGSLGLNQRQFDAVICCETLEHLPYEAVPRSLDDIAAIGARYLVLSVPFMGSQLTFEFYANRFMVKKYTSLKKFMGWKRFPVPKDSGDWEPHKWEIGYRNFPLDAFLAMVSKRFSVLETDFTAGCRSVFVLAENRNHAGR